MHWNNTVQYVIITESKERFSKHHKIAISLEEKHFHFSCFASVYDGMLSKGILSLLSFLFLLCELNMIQWKGFQIRYIYQNVNICT